MKSSLGRSNTCQAARRRSVRWQPRLTCHNERRTGLGKGKNARALFHPPCHLCGNATRRWGIIHAASDAAQPAPSETIGESKLPGSKPKPNLFQKVLLFLSSVSPKAESGHLLKTTLKLLKKYWWALLLLFLARDGLQFLLHRITHRLTNLAAEAVFEYPMSSLVINPWWLVLDAEFLEQHSGYQLMMVVFFMLALPLNLLLNCGSTAIMMLLCTKTAQPEAPKTAATAPQGGAPTDGPPSSTGSSSPQPGPQPSPAADSALAAATPPSLATTPDLTTAASHLPATSATSSSSSGNGADALTKPPPPPSTNGSSSTSSTSTTSSTASAGDSQEKSNGDASSSSTSSTSSTAAAAGVTAAASTSVDGSGSGSSSPSSTPLESSSTSNGRSKADGTPPSAEVVVPGVASNGESKADGMPPGTEGVVPGVPSNGESKADGTPVVEAGAKGKSADDSQTSTVPAESAAAAGRPTDGPAAATAAASAAAVDSNVQDKASGGVSEKESMSSVVQSSPGPSLSPSTSAPSAPIRGPRHAWAEIKSMMPEVWSIMGRIWWVELLVSGASLGLQGLLMLIIPVIWTLPWLLSIQLALVGSVLKGHKGLDALRQSHETMAGYRPAYFWPFMTLLIAVRVVDTLRAGAFALMPNRYWTDAIEIPIVVYILIALLRFAVSRLQDLLPLAAYLRITSGEAVKVPTDNPEAPPESDTATSKPIPSTAL